MSLGEQPILSFAIPTYNFAAFIPATVHSIFDGLPNTLASKLEVVIVDGASADDTAAVVDGLIEKYPSVRYIRMPKRGGIDFDLNHAVASCHAPYVWMLSADDTLDPEWSHALLPLIVEHQPDVVLIPALLCALDMSVMRRNRIFDVAPDQGPKLFQLTNEHSIEQYMRQALTLEALFSYMSAVVVKKETWLSLPQRDDYFGSCWAHCARLAPLLTTGRRSTKVLYLNQFVLRKRSGNDSFMENGLIRRIGITVHGWSRIIAQFFSSTSSTGRLYELLRRDASVLLFLYAKFGSLNKQQREEVLQLARIAYLSGEPNLQAKLKLLSVVCMPSMPRVQQQTQTIIPWLIVAKHKIKGLFH